MYVFQSCLVAALQLGDLFHYFKNCSIVYSYVGMKNMQIY